MIAPPFYALLVREELRDLRRQLGVQLHDVACLNELEQTLDILIPQADASVRSRVADRLRIVGAVDAESLFAETDPSRADGICGAGRDDLAGTVVGRIDDAVHDRERADGARRPGGADGDGKRANHFVVLDDDEPAVGNADDDAAAGFPRPVRTV